jgi:DNA-binding NtrC family response regulator
LIPWLHLFSSGEAMARILIAEADQLIREFIASILADCGHTVETCANAAEAAISLATHAIDVVISDLVLELGDQTSLGRDCAALGIPTLTLSGRRFSPDQSVAERPLALLEKPFRFDDLQTVLDAVATAQDALCGVTISRSVQGATIVAIRDARRAETPDFPRARGSGF